MPFYNLHVLIVSRLSLQDMFSAELFTVLRLQKDD